MIAFHAVQRRDGRDAGNSRAVMRGYFGLEGRKIG